MLNREKWSTGDTNVLINLVKHVSKAEVKCIAGMYICHNTVYNVGTLYVADASHFDVDPDPDPGIHIWK